MKNNRSPHLNCSFLLGLIIWICHSMVYGNVDTFQLAETPTQPMGCQEIFACNSNEASTAKHFLDLEATQCQAEQDTLKCESMLAELTDPKDRVQVLSKIRSCKPESICTQREYASREFLKGCYWAADEIKEEIWKEIKETWEKISDRGLETIATRAKAGADRVSQCLNDNACKNRITLITLIAANPILRMQFLNQQVSSKISYQKAVDATADIIEAGKKYYDDKNLKLQCFDKAAQAEMICHGAIMALAPGAALKVASKAPHWFRLLKIKTVQAAKKTPEALVDKARRKPDEPNPRKTPDSARSPKREKLIKDNLHYEATTTAQNEAWIKEAQRLKPDGKTKHFEIENAAIKELNDTTQDKNFVTALTNKHKKIVFDKIKALEKDFPDVEVLPYSDFKSMRFAFKPKPPLKEIPADFEARLAKIFEESKSDFVKFMEAEGHTRGVSLDKMDKWFHAGFGETADQATLASRYSREAGGGNFMRRYSDADFKENLQVAVKQAELFRKDLQSEFGKSAMMENIPGTKKKIFKPEVFESIRKSKSPEDLIETMKKTYGVEVTPGQATRILDYGKTVDDFSPGIHVAKRSLATLSDSPHGGFSIDFAGLGAQNLRETAMALARSNSLDTAVVQTRISERGVTALFNQKKDSVQAKISKILKDNGIESEIVQSGDDMVVKPKKPIPPEVRAKVADTLAEDVGSSIRVSHVPGAGIDGSSRMIVATHGETIEKLVQKNLLGDIPKERLKQILFMVDMKAESVGRGTAELVIGGGRTPINDIEREKIKRAFKKAVDQLNSDVKKDYPQAAYREAS